MTFSPELCFVIEDNGTVIGYALAALNAKEFYQKLQVSWLPEMCSKYPLPDIPNEEVQSVSQVSCKNTYFLGSKVNFIYTTKRNII